MSNLVVGSAKHSTEDITRGIIQATEWPIDRFFDDLEVHIRASLVHHATMKYEVRPLMLHDDGNGRPLKFQFWNDNGTLDATLDVEKGLLLCRGDIRFDGCSHNYFGEKGEGYIHGCGREHMTRLGAIFQQLFDMAIELMPAHTEYLT